MSITVQPPSPLTPGSETIHPQSYQVTIDGTVYELIDTPGFGDTQRTDDEIFRCICEYLSSSYASGELFSGIIYLHSLAHTRMQGSMMAQIRAFKALCGADFYSHLTIGTSFNETTTETAAARSRREEQLFSSDGYFGDLIDCDTKRATVTQDRNACINLIKTFADYSPVPLQIQAELHASGGIASQTTAAAALSPEQIARQREHEAQVQREAEAAARERAETERRATEERERVAAALAAAERQRQREYDDRQREYAEQERQRRADARHGAYLRQLEEEEAARQKEEAEKARKRIAEAKRKAEAKRLKEKREKEQREEEHRQRMEELREEREAKERISRSKAGFRYRDLAWVCAAEPADFSFTFPLPPFTRSSIPLLLDTNANTCTTVPQQRALHRQPRHQLLGFLPRRHE